MIIGLKNNRLFWRSDFVMARQWWSQSSQLVPRLTFALFKQKGNYIGNIYATLLMYTIQIHTLLFFLYFYSSKLISTYDQEKKRKRWWRLEEWGYVCIQVKMIKWSINRFWFCFFFWEIPLEIWCGIFVVGLFYSSSTFLWWCRRSDDTVTETQVHSTYS